jgi:predicted amidohydrolase
MKQIIAVLTLVMTVSLKAQVKPIIEIMSPPTPANVQDYFKIAVVQWNPSQNAPVGSSTEITQKYLQNNREEMAVRITTAKNNGAQYVAFSEFAVVGYPDIPELPPEEDEFRNRQDIKPFVDTVPGLSTAYFSQVAIKKNIWIQFGLAEVETTTNKYFNTVVVIDNKGKIVASFRKHSLYQLENQFLSAGDQPIVFNSPMGKVGLAICADIYNQSLLNTYKKLDVDIIGLSASWAQMNTGMNMFVNAAKNNSMYVFVANQTYFPDSGVINPNGSIQSHIRQSLDEIAYGYIPLAQKN